MLLSTLKLSQRASHPRAKFPLKRAERDFRVGVNFRRRRWGLAWILGDTGKRQVHERERKSVSRNLDTVSESHRGLLAHIIDSRVAARDAPALLCPVERWQEAWFRDNSFLIACLIHTIRNYPAVPCAYARFSKSFGRTHLGNEAVRSRLLALLRARALFSPIFRPFSAL